MDKVLLGIVIAFVVTCILLGFSETKPNAGDYVMNKCDGLDEVTVSSPENLTAWEICLNEALEEYKREYP